MSDDFHATLEQLLNNNEELLDQLEKSASVDAALEVLVDAASQARLELDTAHLLVWLEEGNSQEQSLPKELSQDALEEIAAGKRYSNTRTMGGAAARILRHVSKPAPAVFGPQVE